MFEGLPGYFPGVFQGIIVNYCKYCNYCTNDILLFIVAFSYGSNKGKGTG